MVNGETADVGLRYPALETVGRVRIEGNTGDIDLSLPALTDITAPFQEGDFDDVVGLAILGNEGSVTVHFAVLAELPQVIISDQVSDVGVSGGDVVVDAPSLLVLRDLECFRHAGDLELRMDALDDAVISVQASGLRALALAALTTGTVFLQDLDVLGSVELPALVDAGLFIGLAPALTTLRVPAQTRGTFSLMNVPALAPAGFEPPALVDVDTFSLKLQRNLFDIRVAKIDRIKDQAEQHAAKSRSPEQPASRSNCPECQPSDHESAHN